jgi:hypothetical protein
MSVLILSNPESKNWESKHDYGDILQWTFLIFQVCDTYSCSSTLSVEHDWFNFQSDRVVHKLENCPDFFYLQYPMDVNKDLEGENGATVTWNHVNGEFQWKFENDDDLIIF